MTGCSTAHPRTPRLEPLIELLDEISTAELRIGPDCEILHRTGDGPKKAVRVLRAYCDTREGRDFRRWLGVNRSPEVADRVFSMLEGIAEALQEMRNEVIDLNNANVSAVDYPDEDFWIRVYSIEVRWDSIRKQAESARACLAGLVGKTPTPRTA